MKHLVLLALFVSCAVSVFGSTSVVRDVPYGSAVPSFQTGDIHLPEGWTADTPVVLVIHGGGWTSGDQASCAGVAEFFRRDLGMAVYNIEYRLASAENPWPACGEDCVAAAKFVLGPAFAARTGLRPKRIWIWGASAGGHLALWTGLSLPPEQVAGIISVSGIGDPSPDRATHESRYAHMEGAGRPPLDPATLIRPHGPKVLQTHATDDRVVPIASARNFAAKCRAAGNEVRFLEYPCDIEPGLTGHCIWRPGSDPHRLIAPLEREIARFIGRDRYIPEPKPVRSDVEITAIYYPGTDQMAEWDMIGQTMPQTKPLLGWYDEGDPENIDWQIKWSVEHGITSFLVDWYWCKGVQRLDHWVKAFPKARFRRYMKWYLNWCNHNDPGAHTTADQVAVTKWWIDNYFRTDEYYKDESGRPLVLIWTWEGMDRDFIDEAAKEGRTLKRGEGLKYALDLSRRLAREAGLPGIRFGVFTSGRDRSVSGILRAAGIEELFQYTFFSPWQVKEGLPESRRAAYGEHETPWTYPFSWCREASPGWWRANWEKDDIPCWPTLAAGWNSCPRDFMRANRVTDRTVADYRRICVDAAAFCRETGCRRIVIGPVNEWQEGSYVEPNEEFGFGMYDAMREVFCAKPADGWPENLTPSAIGRPNPQFPPMEFAARTAWDFDDGVQGWYRNPYGAQTIRAHDGVLEFFRSFPGRSPVAIRTRLKPFAAKDFRAFRIRMRLKPNLLRGKECAPKGDERLRLMWGAVGRPIVKREGVTDLSGQVSAKAFTDGEWHEYELPLAENPKWTGEIDELWFDPSELWFINAEIDWMRFE